MIPGSTGYLDPAILEALSLPKTRADCVSGPRPCPHVICRHHLAHEVGMVGPETCSLDVADRGPHTLEEVGIVMGFTRERIRQLEALAMIRLKDKMYARADSTGQKLDDLVPWTEKERQ